MGPIWRITHIDMDRSGVYEWQVTGRSHWAPTTKVKHDPVKICLFTQRFNWIVRHSMINWRWICSASVGQSLHPVDALNRWLADKERAAVDRDKFMPTAGRNLKRIVLRLPAKRNDLASSLTSSTHMGVVITMQMTFLLDNGHDGRYDHQATVDHRETSSWLQRYRTAVTWPEKYGQLTCSRDFLTRSIN